jgi:pimeloyl-ACP methyl ester carboxylesterase
MLRIRTGGRHERKSKTLLAAGHKTHYHEAGQGEALFLLHGSGPGVSGWANWANTVPVFADRWRVVVPDIAGFGFTEFKEDAKYDIKLWVSHLLGIMDALDIEKASFIGNSFGGAWPSAWRCSRRSGSTSWCCSAPRPVNSYRPRACAVPGNTSRPWTTCAS